MGIAVCIGYSVSMRVDERHIRPPVLKHRKFSVIIRVTQEMVDYSEVLEGEVENVVRFYLKTEDLSPFAIYYRFDIRTGIYLIRVDSQDPYPGLYPCAEAEEPPHRSPEWTNN